MVTEIKEQDTKTDSPKFVDPSELTTEQLTDPDYRIKQIARDTGMSEQELVVCSKCHHCRR